MGQSASEKSLMTSFSIVMSAEERKMVSSGWRYDYRPLSRSGHHNTRTRPSPHEQLKDGFQREGDAPVLDDKNLNNVQIPPSSPSV